MMLMKREGHAVLEAAVAVAGTGCRGRVSGSNNGDSFR